MKTIVPPAPLDPVLVYQTEDGLIRVDVRVDGETVWLSQEQMALLFQRERSVITKHIRNAFFEGELLEESNVQNLHIANSDKPVKLYNLDVIISVGYRVKSLRGTQFRIWATQRLHEYLTKGFAKEMADQIATLEYEKYRTARRLADEARSDFDALTNGMNEGRLKA